MHNCCLHWECSECSVCYSHITCEHDTIYLHYSQSMYYININNTLIMIEIGIGIVKI